MAASKVKDTVEELQAQIRKLAERFDKERRSRSHSWKSNWIKCETASTSN